MSDSAVPPFAIPAALLDPATPAYFDAGLGTWNVFGYADVTRVLTDHANFSMDYGDPEIHPSYAAMWFQDPPRHTDLRTLTDRRFHVAAVHRLTGTVTRVVDGLIDNALAAGRADVVTDLAQPLPAMVVCELLGLDLAETDRFLGWLREEHRLLSLGDFSGEPAMIAALTELVRRPAGRDGIIADLLAAYADGHLVDGRPLSERDLLGYVYMLLSASFGATTTAIGNHLLALVQHDLWPRLRADPGLIPGAVEESLRWDTPMPALRTRAVADLTIGGRAVRAGEFVTGWMSAANRDPAEFRDPSAFDPARRPNRHLAFGRGVHYCLGAELGRLEMRVLTERLLTRVPPEVHLAQDRPVSRSFGLLHGVAEATLTWPSGRPVLGRECVVRR